MPLTATAVAPLLRIEQVSKSFGGVRVLKDVTLDFHAGEIVALVGQNGCGKSTLVKILTGYHDPDPGASFFLNGEPAVLGKSRIESHELHLPVRVVYQDAGLVGGLDAVDNIALVTGYALTGLGRVDWHEQDRRTRAALSMVQADNIDIHAPASQLDVLQRAQIAIARAVGGWSGNGGLLLLDEPTSALTDPEVERLFEILEGLRAANVSIVYVSHRLEEVLRIADRVVIARDGDVVAVEETKHLHYDRLVELMVGEGNVAKALRTRPDVVQAESTSGTAAPLSIRNLRSSLVRDLSLAVDAGEIVGVTGLAGSGHEHVPYLVVGARQADGGTVVVAGAEFDARVMSPRLANAIGLVLVPSDRLVTGLVSGFTVEDNITLPRVSSFAALGWLHARKQRAYAHGWITALDIQPPRPDAPVLALSGGNQQKVVVGKCLGIARTALVLAEPTAGVDVGARAAIYERLSNEAARGLPILVSSSDTEDLVQICRRVLILRRGEVIAQLAGNEVTKEQILHACGRDAT